MIGRYSIVKNMPENSLALPRNRKQKRKGFHSVMTSMTMFAKIKIRLTSFGFCQS